MKRNLLLMGALWLSLGAGAQTATWSGHRWQGTIGPGGTLERIVFKSGEQPDTVPFFRPGKGRNPGPTFYAEVDGRRVSAPWKPDGYLSYRATIDEVECRLTYKEWRGHPALEVTLENKGHTPFQPTRAGLKLGVDTYMDKYPDWFGKYFPTLLLNEPTHFYGYLQTPGGHTLGLVSPQPVAAWSIDYNLGYQDPAPHWFMGHRIESVNLDLLNALPLPAHCPQDLWQLRPQEQKTWTLALVDVPDAAELEPLLHRVGGIPMLHMAQTSFRPGETAEFDVWAADGARISVSDDRGRALPLRVGPQRKGCRHVSCTLPERGLYTVRVDDGEKRAEGTLAALPSWQWTLRQARSAALTYHQKATSHVESWYGFYSVFIAGRFFPEARTDAALSRRFDRLFVQLNDTTKMEPRYYAFRIQNTASTIGMLVDKYEAYGEMEDMNRAARLADWLISTWQRKDGAYVNRGTVYTSVIYVAKSILELVLAERELGKSDPRWQQAADRHYASAKRAIDQLVASQGDFETEGELTFEDGMISCSALQIGMLGLMQPDAAARKHYTDAMLQILHSHDCLTQLHVPDARRRGGTMRYWEAQYDVQMLPNMFNSPHGWSAWRAYATYYAYLLTGDERWLRETQNALGAFAQLVDYHSGKLRWAFVVDPYLRVKQACSADTHVTADSVSFGNPHPELYDTRSFVIGEQYVDMISDWQTVNTQDNDVHEVFKCMGEAVLTNAFVVERPDGTIVGYNCRVKQRGDRLEVEPAEKQITHLHCNLRRTHEVRFKGHTRRLDGPYLGWAFGTDIYLGR